MNVSKRVLAMQESPIRKLVPYALKAKERGLHVYHLNIGQPDIETPSVFMDAIRDAHPKVLEYAHSAGWQPLREGFAAYYRRIGVDLAAEDVIVTNGGSEALIFALLTVCDPGEAVLVPEPFYTNYRGFSLPYDVNVLPITTSPDNGFALPDKATIASLITPKTRAILFSNPGNPTGAVYDRETLKTLVELALEHDLYLIADEVYREFAYEGHDAISVGTFKEASDRILLIDSVSKRFSACGARIGMLGSKNKEVMANVLKLAQSRLCVPTLEMIGAKALYELDPSYFNTTRETYKARRDAMIDGLNAIPGVFCRRPKGAFYAIATLPVDDAESFAIWMLESFSHDNATVMVAPAENFYQTKGLGKNEARLAYVLKKHDIEQAMQCLAIALDQYPGRIRA